MLINIIMINRRKYNYLSIKSFLLSIVIFTFTSIALYFYGDLEQIIGLKAVIITCCFLLVILFNLETIMEENSLYYLICKAISFVWYICFSTILYKYILILHEK